MRHFLSLALCAAAVSLGGCYSITHDASALPDGDATLTRKKDARVVRMFKAEDRAWYLIAGLLPMGNPNLADTIRKESYGRQVQAVRIKNEMSPIDVVVYIGGSMLMSYAAYSLVNPVTPQQATTASLVALLLTPQTRTITIEGEVLDDHSVGAPASSPSPLPNAAPLKPPAPSPRPQGDTQEFPVPFMKF